MLSVSCNVIKYLIVMVMPIDCLEQQNQLCGLKCELMSELGALLMHTGDAKLVVYLCVPL